MGFIDVRTKDNIVITNKNYKIMFTESFITTSGVVCQKTAFYGSEKYGDEIISTLEKHGGINCGLSAHNENKVYFLGNDNVIQCCDINELDKSQQGYAPITWENYINSLYILTETIMIEEQGEEVYREKKILYRSQDFHRLQEKLIELFKELVSKNNCTQYTKIFNNKNKKNIDNATYIIKADNEWCENGIEDHYFSIQSLSNVEVI